MSLGHHNFQVPRKRATDLVKQCICILRYVKKLANVLWARSSRNKEGSNRENILHLFFCCSKESYGCEVVFVPDVDYFGDPYRTRRNPRKQGKPLGSV